MKKLLAVLLFVPVVSHATFFTGNELYSRMNGSDVQKLTALGYVLAIHDTFFGEVICSPPAVTAGQMRDVVQKYLQENPTNRDMGAAVLSMIALGSAYPCPKKKGKTL
jgi:hypothetical protein